MKSTFALATALAAMTFSVSSAKEHYVVAEAKEQHEHKRPMVEEQTQKCAYDEASFKLCGTYGASMKVGWEWQQEYYALTEATKYYTLRLDAYSLQGINLEGEFKADRLYTNKTSIILDQFKGLLTMELKHWYFNGRTCMAIFYAIDDLIYEVSVRMQFVEASKNILQHLWTLDNWDSPNALWLDSFGLSDYTPITIFKREIQQEEALTMLYGTNEDTSVNCSPGYLFTNIPDWMVSTKAQLHPLDQWIN